MRRSVTGQVKMFLGAFFHHEGGLWFYTLCACGLPLLFVLLGSSMAFLYGPRPTLAVVIADSSSLQVRPLSPSRVFPLPPPESIPLKPSPRPQHPPPLYTYAHTVKKGENFSQLITASGVSPGDATRATHAMKKHFNPRTLMAGHQILLTIRTQPSDAALLERLVIHPNSQKQIQITRQSSGRYRATKLTHPMTQTRHYTAKGKILNNLYTPAKEAGLPPQLIADLIHLYSFQIDFQRDLRPNDRFEVFYTMQSDKSGRFSEPGEILYASITLRGKPLALWFHKPNGRREGDYYTAQGKSVRGFLMKTPLEIARVSSPFGMRRHPILGYTRMHSGVDFAAPIGTPVYAAGDGVVVEATHKGSYGKYIRIQHKLGYQTVYAHLHKFAQDIKKNRRVTQGDIIAYVGSTGISTGPHLHYEVIHKGRKINPRTMRSPSAGQLAPQEQLSFEQARRRINSLRQRHFAHKPPKPPQP